MSGAAEIFNHRYEDDDEYNDDYAVDNLSPKIITWIPLPSSSSSSSDDSGPHDGAGAVDRLSPKILPSSGVRTPMLEIDKPQSGTAIISLQHLNYFYESSPRLTFSLVRPHELHRNREGVLSTVPAPSCGPLS